MKELDNCIINAMKDEERGRKHKGLLYIGPNKNAAIAYIQKAKKNLRLCKILKEQEYDYKLPEEWFYTMYYCALAILIHLGIESRSQRCTALLLQYLSEKNIINYDKNLIDRITIHKQKEQKSDVDAREEARYGPSTEAIETKKKSQEMERCCSQAIDQTEEIIYNSSPNLPEELREFMIK